MPKANSGSAPAPVVRVVLDTNGWISNYISPRSALNRRLNQLLDAPAVTVLFSEALRVEILRVLRRPKFSKYLSAERLALCEAEIVGFDLTPVTAEVAVCRDPKDDYLLALCLDGHADFLITGDQDLLVLKAFGSTRIISWAEAEAELLVS